jgi:hypothetical protein
MPASLSIVLVLLAQASGAGASADAGHPVYGPAAPPPVKAAAPPAQTAERECAPQNKDPNAKEIVVCAVKPQGYRLPADIVEARRLKKKGLSGRPHNPHETYADHVCATVGPMGCRGGPTINLLAAAATLGEMADRLSKGKEIGSMFKTDPSPSEYQLFQEAKKAREAKEAEAAAKAKAKAAQAAAAGQTDAAKAEKNSQ